MRLIKTIGDEVMLVSTDPVALLDGVLDLVDANEPDDRLPRLRVGVATGMAVSRAGDWYGSPVNLASRVTGLARPQRWRRQRATSYREGVNRRSRRLLVTTNTELKAIAAPAIRGLSKPRAANGNAAVL